MKIALISDTHGLILPALPAGVEAVIHAGDVCPDNYKAGRHQVAWLREIFAPWAEMVDVPIFVVPGNHDFCFERVPDACLDAVPDNVDIVVDQTRIIGGRKVWFSPWSRTFGGWAFMETEDRLADRYAQIPEDTEILVSHGPPYGYGDIVGADFLNAKIDHVGSTALRHAIDQLHSLEHVVCGHIHEGRGTYTHEIEKFGGIVTLYTVHNVACVDAAYRPVPNGPVILEI